MKIPIRQYAQLLCEMEKEIGKKTEKDALRKLALFIRKNKDIKKLNKIFEKYKELKKEKTGLKNTVVVTREKLDSEEINKIRKVIADKFLINSEKIIIINDINKDIGGGIVIKVENEIWDGSLKTKIEKTRMALLA